MRMFDHGNPWALGFQDPMTNLRQRQSFGGQPQQGGINPGGMFNQHPGLAGYEQGSPLGQPFQRPANFNPMPMQFGQNMPMSQPSGGYDGSGINPGGMYGGLAGLYGRGYAL